MATISSPGIGSGLDVNGIVSKLMAIEQQPLTDLAKKEASFQAKISAYGSLKGALSTLQGALSGLSDGSKFSNLTTAFSDSGYAIATAGSGASAGAHTLSIGTLAQAQSLMSQTFTDTTTAIGSGTLTIQYGTYNSSGNTFTPSASGASDTVTIDAQHMSLTGIRDAINAANINATASITNDGTGYRLVLTSNNPGTANSLKLSVSDPSLSALTYDPTGVKNMTQSQAAQDATFTLDGINITKSSNVVTDALQGVTLTLSKPTTSPLTLSISRDTSSVSGALNSFVKAFNDATKAIKDLTAYDPKTKTASALTGDTTVMMIQAQMRRLLTSPVKNSSGLSYLSDIGVSFQKDGTLALNNTKLQSVLADPTKDVSTLLASVGKATDPLISVLGSGSNTKSGTYAINIDTAASQGTLTGSAAPATSTITTGVNDALSVSVNNTSAAVTLTAGTYTPTALAALVQSAINGSSALRAASIGVSVGYNGTQGTAVGSAAAGLTITAGSNDTLSLSVDGVASGNITLDAKTYTAAGLATALQAKINADATLSAAGKSVLVTVSNGVLTIASDSYGAGSSIAGIAGNGASGLLGTPNTTLGTGSNKMVITSNTFGSASTISAAGNASASLLGGAPVAVTGVDVAGTINGQPATGSGQNLTSASGDSVGLKLKITGTGTGNRGTVAFSIGYASQLSSLLTDMLSTKGTIETHTSSTQKSIDNIGKQRDRISQQLTVIEARYRAQFTALDSTISSMQATQQYLTQQLTALSSLTKTA